MSAYSNIITVNEPSNGIPEIPVKQSNDTFLGLPLKSIMIAAFIGLIASVAICLAMPSNHKIHNDFKMHKYANIKQNGQSTAFSRLFSPVEFDVIIIGNNTNSPSSCQNDLEDCSGEGYCTRDGSTCVCFSGHVTYNSPNGPKCNYKQKSQLAAFLLQLFLGKFGAGHFYVGSNALGAGEICLTFGLIPLACFLTPMFNAFDVSETGRKKIWKKLQWVVGTAVFVWWLVNTIKFGLNEYNDGNGVPLKSW
jgi:TM2 domain-containing membrane protein YozV